MATERETTIERDEFVELADSIDGVLLRPGDNGYEEARIIHNAAYQCSPSLILQAATAEDVSRGIAVARDRGLEVAIRSGGHSIPGHSSSDDMVIDLTPMRSIEIDPSARIVRVGGGLTWAEISWELQAYGLAVPSGDTGSVGVGGLTTGGGIGWLVRKHGLAIDSLRAVEIVTADGRILRAADDENPDLFWGVRGGGGNFGVVTSFEFQAHRVGTIVGGAIVYDAAEAREVLSGWARYASKAPEELSTIVFIMYAPPLPFIPTHMHGRLAIIIGVCCVGDPEEGQRAVEPLRHLGTLVTDFTAATPYPIVYELTKDVAIPGFHTDVRSVFLRQFGDDEVRAVLRRMDTMAPPMDVIQLRGLGGAMARVPSDATAFAHRDKEFMALAVSLWTDPAETRTRRAWVEAFLREFEPLGDGVYVNFLSEEGQERIVEAYGLETYHRLAALKARYDPSNLFRLNQNIPPVAAQGT